MLCTANELFGTLNNRDTIQRAINTYCIKIQELSARGGYRLVLFRFSTNLRRVRILSFFAAAPAAASIYGSAREETLSVALVSAPNSGQSTTGPSRLSVVAAPLRATLGVVVMDDGTADVETDGTASPFNRGRRKNFLRNRNEQNGRLIDTTLVMQVYASCVVPNVIA